MLGQKATSSDRSKTLCVAKLVHLIGHSCGLLFCIVSGAISKIGIVFDQIDEGIGGALGRFWKQFDGEWGCLAGRLRIGRSCGDFCGGCTGETGDIVETHDGGNGGSRDVDVSGSGGEVGSDFGTIVGGWKDDETGCVDELEEGATARVFGMNAAVE